MRLIKSIFIVLSFILIFGVLDVEASFSIDDIDTQISPTSSSVKIKNIQKLFAGLGLYNGDIDGDYNSIEKTLLDYQIDTGIVENPWDWGAGYFGKKTTEKLLEDFGDKFKNLALLHIKKPEVDLGRRKFIVTAYYSPLPGQKRYLKGSYQADIRLNGGGKVTASGEGVFPGLLAAPTNYDFGTKIKLDGIGVGIVEDRGGAIVNAGERGHSYDRIDVWMGYGDDGLERAIKWGKREVVGEVVGADEFVNVEFDVSPVVAYENLKVDAENPKEENVKDLQNLMSEVGLYKGEIDGNYDNVKDELIDFQIKHSIISSKNDAHAGYFGEKTLGVFRKEFGSGIFKKPEYYVYLNLERKQKLLKIRNLLVDFIENKSKGNKLVEYKYRLSLKTTLDNYVVKISSKVKREEIKYLKNIL